VAALTTLAVVGNWSDGPGAWQLGVAATSGDTGFVAAGATITVDVDTTVGTSPASTTAAGSAVVTVGTGTSAAATLIVPTGVTLTCLGSLVVANGAAGKIHELQINGTGAVVPDATSSGAGTTFYSVFNGSAGFQSFCRVKVRGTVGAWAEIRGGAAGAQTRLVNGGNQSGIFDLQGLKVSKAGGSTWSAILLQQPIAAMITSWQDVLVDGCSGPTAASGVVLFAAVQAGASLPLTRMTMQNTATAVALLIAGATQTTAATVTLTGCTVDATFSATIDGVTGNDNYFENTTTGAVFNFANAGKSLSFTNTFLRNRSSASGSPSIVGSGTWNRVCYLRDTAAVNPHGWAFLVGGNCLLNGMVYQTNSADDSGDSITTSGTAVATNAVVEFKNILNLPNTARTSVSGTAPTMSGPAGTDAGFGTILFRLSRFTTCVRTSGAVTGCVLGESNAGRAGMVDYIQDSLYYALSATATGNIVTDQGTPGPIDGLVTFAGYNATFNLSNADVYGAADAKFGSTPGTGDQRIPGTVAPWAGGTIPTTDYLTYAVSLGLAGTFAALATYMKTRHTGGGGGATAIATCYDTIMLGWKPSGSVAATYLWNTVRTPVDGARTIGAVEMDDPGGTAVVALTPSGLTFNATQGGSAPASQPVSVTEGSGGALTGLGVSFSYGGGWASGLSGSFDTTTAPATLTVSATQGVLAPGTYTAMGTVSGTGATSATFNVTLIVAPDPVAPGLGVSETRCVVNATVGGANPPPGTIRVRNVGGGVLSGLALGAISYGGGWASGLTATLDVTTAPAVVTFQATTGALAIGKYTATVSLSASAVGAVGTPQTLTLEFGVEAAVTVRALGGNGAAG
jgi:hypothetical protein